MMYAIKPRFQQSLHPITQYCIRHHVPPTYLNIAGLVSSLLLAVALYFSLQMPLLLIFVPILAFVRTAFNALDGLVSREQKISTGFGEVLNEFLDRVSDVIIFFTLAITGYAQIAIASLAVISIQLNSYLGIVNKAAGGKRIYSGFMGKADRMLYLSIFALVVLFFHDTHLWNYFFIFILVGTIITLIQRFMESKKELHG